MSWVTKVTIHECDIYSFRESETLGQMKPYQWESVEGGVRLGDVRVICGHQFHAVSVQPQGWFRKSRVTWYPVK